MRLWTAEEWESVRVSYSKTTDERIQRNAIAWAFSCAARRTLAHPAPTVETHGALSLLADELGRLAAQYAEGIVAYPVHSEPVGGAMEMQDIAHNALNLNREK